MFITEQLKTTKPGSHQIPLDLISYPDDKNLCIFHPLKECISRTAQLRQNNWNLFISFQKLHLPGTKDTIARWVKTTLKSAGINTEIFAAHSCRGASTSAAQAAGLSLTAIMRSAGWSNAKTFARFYSIFISPDNFGHSVFILL